MNELESRLAGFLAGLGGRRLLVAFSGGLDSCVLACTLGRLAPDHRARVGLAYFNHRLRGAESAAEEQFCRAWAAEQALKLRVGGWADPAASEEKARAARYAWLTATASADGFDAIVTAHHRRDQAETLLMRLLRGTGPRGAGAMKPAALAPGSGLPLLRPMLDLGRDELLAEAHKLGLRWFEDSSNATDAFLRNRVRRRLLPVLQELEPDAEARLAHFARLAQEETEAFDWLLGRELGRELELGQGWAVLPRRLFRVNAALSRQLLLTAGVRLGASASDMPLGKLLEAAAVARDMGTEQRDFELGDGLRAHVLRDSVALLRGAPWLPEPAGLPRPLPLESPLVGSTLDLTLELVRPWKSSPRVRTRQPGDRLWPGKKMLKGLFIERRVPRFLRERYPVVEDELGIACVPRLWKRTEEMELVVDFGPTWPTPLLPSSRTNFGRAVF